jgi:phosphonate transport system substrate-binding protein
LSNHYGAYYYGSQFLVNVSSGFSLFYDPIADRNTAVADTALLQFADKRPCFVEPTSASGYILPKSILIENAFETQDPVWIQTHTGIVRALYIRDICDFGVTFAISGDPRTATSIQQDLPDTMNRIVVVWKSDAVIPSLNISFLPELSSDLVYDVMDALISMAATPDGKLLLTDATGYDIQGLMKIEDSDYDPLRQTLETTQLDLASLVGR